ncbi:DUF5412 family protein [Bacillus weihaiensis]|uniref:DUF5412 family protein n=1 Tax=Bacillus weihaiensis TaxID=1547283 RepID=UPI002352DAC8|nr:DUF5412 family protein [Bacillus weihaiensis]
MKRFIIISIITIIFVIILIVYGIYRWSINMNNLPKGDFISEVDSPNGKYTIKAYLSSGGATTGYAVRGELIFNNEEKKTKNIYWDYPQDKALIEWKDYNTVIINDHKLDVPMDTYHFRQIE